MSRSLAELLLELLLVQVRVRASLARRVLESLLRALDSGHLVTVVLLKVFQVVAEMCSLQPQVD
jgi:hypothetical protein